MAAKRGRAPSTRRGPVYLEELALELERYYRRNGNPVETIIHGIKRMRHILAYFGARHDARRIDFTSLSAYMDARLEHAARSTVRVELEALKKAMKLMARAGRLQAIPYFPSVGHYKNPRQGFFEEKDFRAIQAELPAELRPLAEFMFWTGWRNRECRELLWAEVDFAAGHVFISARRAKNKRGKHWPLSFAPLRRLLKRQLAATEARAMELGKVIPTVFWRARDGRPILNWGDAWRGARKRAGLPMKNPHDCRRTTFRRLSIAGVRREIQKDIVGVRSDDVWDDYNIRITGDYDHEIRKLADPGEDACNEWG